MTQAAEVTAGYANDYLNKIAAMLKETNTVLDFTCFEMLDATQAWTALSRPQGLVAAAAAAARDNGIEFAGENALACWESEVSIAQVEEACAQAVAAGATMCGFTALRLDEDLIAPGSGQRRALTRFIANMGNLPARAASRSLPRKLLMRAARLWQTYKAATLLPSPHLASQVAAGALTVAYIARSGTAPVACRRGGGCRCTDVASSVQRHARVLVQSNRVEI